jgi:hypothetical protein
MSVMTKEMKEDHVKIGDEIRPQFVLNLKLIMYVYN